jgi:hypothetical protein
VPAAGLLDLVLLVRLEGDTIALDLLSVVFAKHRTLLFAVCALEVVHALADDADLLGQVALLLLDGVDRELDDGVGIDVAEVPERHLDAALGCELLSQGFGLLELDLLRLLPDPLALASDDGLPFPLRCLFGLGLDPRSPSNSLFLVAARGDVVGQLLALLDDALTAQQRLALFAQVGRHGL